MSRERFAPGKECEPYGCCGDYEHDGEPYTCFLSRRTIRNNWLRVLHIELTY